jgi:hypothetical protein
MRRETINVVAIAVFLLLALGFGWYELRAVHAADSALADLTGKAARLDADVHEAEFRLKASRGDAVTLRAKLHGLAMAAAARNRPDPSLDPSVFIAADPKLRDLYLKWFKANLVVRYGAMYQALGFSQEQIDKFEELTTAREGERMDIRGAAMGQGLTSADPANGTLQKQSIDQYNAALSASLGEGVVEQVNQVFRTQPGEILVSDISSLVPPGAPPLTSAQSGQLLQIMANANPTYQSGGRIDPSAINWNNITAGAAAILSGPQLQALNAEAQLARIAAKANQFYSQPPANK